jgi:hypothetical protein
VIYLQTIFFMFYTLLFCAFVFVPFALIGWLWAMIRTSFLIGEDLAGWHLDQMNDLSEKVKNQSEVKP